MRNIIGKSMLLICALVGIAYAGLQDVTKTAGMLATDSSGNLITGGRPGSADGGLLDSLGAGAQQLMVWNDAGIASGKSQLQFTDDGVSQTLVVISGATPVPNDGGIPAVYLGITSVNPPTAQLNAGMGDFSTAIALEIYAHSFIVATNSIVDLVAPSVYLGSSVIVIAATTSLPSCDVSSVGTIVKYTKAAGATVSICICQRVSSVYSWSATGTGDCT